MNEKRIDEMTKHEIIDIHCHLLPDVDDGSKNMEDTVKALRMAARQGVTKIIMTPHYFPGSTLTAQRVLDLTKEVQRTASENGIEIEMFSGMEFLYFSELASLLEKGEVLTLAGSRYVLVEFQEDVPYQYIERGLDSIRDSGFIPILAHYERYNTLTTNNRVKKLKEKGFLLQMNYDTIQREYNLFKRNPFHQDIKNGYVDFFGSDCHGSKFRKYFLDPSVNWLEANVDSEQLRNLTRNNPMMILADE